VGFQKFQKSEEVENVTEEVKVHLEKTAKSSVSEMSEEEKKELNKDLNKENENA